MTVIISIPNLPIYTTEDPEIYEFGYAPTETLVIDVADAKNEIETGSRHFEADGETLLEIDGDDVVEWSIASVEENNNNKLVIKLTC